MTMDEEQGQYCSNCKKNLFAAENFDSHNEFCQRNVKICKVCDEAVLINSIKEHEEEFHISVKCEKCNASVEKWEMPKHQDVCSQPVVACQFCEGEFLANEAEQHIESCGFRTELCEYCAKYILLKHKKKHIQFHLYKENSQKGNDAGKMHQTTRNESISKSSEKVLESDKTDDFPHKGNLTVADDVEFGSTGEASAPPLETFNQVIKPEKICESPHKSNCTVTDDFKFGSTIQASAPPLETLNQSSRNQSVCHLCRQFILCSEYYQHLKSCIVENSFKKCPRCNENIPPFSWNDHIYKTCSMLRNLSTQLNKSESVSVCRSQTGYAFHDNGMAARRPLSSYAVPVEINIRKICAYCDKELHVNASEELHLRVCEVYKQINSHFSHVPPKTPNRSTSVELLRCIICIDEERDTVFQPCGHLVVCHNCANDVESTCPMCRKHIEKKIKVYIN